MYESDLGKAVLGHKTKLFVVGLAFMAILAACEHFLPLWVVVLLFLASGIFVIAPLALGIGPFGRRFAKKLNESAVAKRDDKCK
jgi:hypothetical protein